MKKLFKNLSVFFAILLAFSFILVLLVYLKSGAKFPVILKRNELGFNFLTQRSRIFNFYILGIIFLLSNLFLARKIQIEEINLRKVLNYANIVIVLLLFIISLQIYFLNL